MTRKDFEIIAGALRKSYQAQDMGYASRELTAIHNTAIVMAEALKATNPRFDTAKFVHYVIGEQS